MKDIVCGMEISDDSAYRHQHGGKVLLAAPGLLTHPSQRASWRWSSSGLRLPRMQPSRVYISFLMTGHRSAYPSRCWRRASLSPSSLARVGRFTCATSISKHGQKPSRAGSSRDFRNWGKAAPTSRNCQLCKTLNKICFQREVNTVT